MLEERLKENNIKRKNLSGNLPELQIFKKMSSWNAKYQNLSILWITGMVIKNFLIKLKCQWKGLGVEILTTMMP